MTYKILWIKKYFDVGLGLTNYAKYLIAFFGLYSVGEGISMNITLIIGIAYIIGCFILGFVWIKFKLIDAENEIDNVLNPFQREVRDKLNGKRFK